MTESMKNVVRKKPLGEIIWKYFILVNAFTFLTFLAPYVSANVSILTANIWMWGGADLEIVGYSPIPAYIRDPSIRLSLAIGGLACCLSILGLFVLGGYMKDHLKMFGKIKYLFILISSVIIVMATVLVVPLQNEVNVFIEGMEDPPIENFWQLFRPGLGMVGPILGTSITLILTGYTWRYYDSIIEAMKPQEVAGDMDEIPTKTEDLPQI